MSRAHRFIAVASSAMLLAALHGTAFAQAAAPVAHLATRADTTHHARGTRVPRARGRSLRAQAKISEDSARTIALTQAPGATLGKAKLEREHGRVIYAFAVKAQDRAAMKGMKEVEVDAVNGQVLPPESAATERKETRKAESHEAKPAASMKAAPAKPAAVRKP